MSIESEKEQQVEEKDMMMKIKEELQQMRKQLDSEREMKTLLLKYDIPQYYKILKLTFIFILANSTLQTTKNYKFIFLLEMFDQIFSRLQDTSITCDITCFTFSCRKVKELTSTQKDIRLEVDTVGSSQCASNSSILIHYRDYFLALRRNQIEHHNYK